MCGGIQLSTFDYRMMCSIVFQMMMEVRLDRIEDGAAQANVQADLEEERYAEVARPEVALTILEDAARQTTEAAEEAIIATTESGERMIEGVDQIGVHLILEELLLVVVQHREEQNQLPRQNSYQCIRHL